MVWIFSVDPSDTYQGVKEGNSQGSESSALCLTIAAILVKIQILTLNFHLKWK